MASLYLETARCDATGAKTRLNVATISAITKLASTDAVIESPVPVNDSTGTYHVVLDANLYGEGTLYYCLWTYNFGSKVQTDRRYFVYSRAYATGADIARCRIVVSDVVRKAIDNGTVTVLAVQNDRNAIVSTVERNAAVVDNDRVAIVQR